MAHALLDMLESVAIRPQMYVAPVTFATVQGYLTGLQMGLRFAGIEYSGDDYAAAARARGWDPRGALGVLRDFEERGIPEEVRIRELVAIEAAAYRRALDEIRADQHGEV